ncbi:MAG: DNA repair protein RecO [Cyanobacteria bacterium RI_101]|nr:DNA repair protein RecO [Cyanobacteria bacterium RI_101]
MSRSYSATGLILKSAPLGEADRLLTILSPEVGLFNAAAPGARKANSALGGRCQLFSVNQFFLGQGRSLARILQAEPLGAYPGLSASVGKLAGGQYLAQAALALALKEQPQGELYGLLREHLTRIEGAGADSDLYGLLAQALFHLLALGGVAPQIYRCCLTDDPITPDFVTLRWQTGFCFEQGGLAPLSFLGQDPRRSRQQRRLGPQDLFLLQQLPGARLPDLSQAPRPVAPRHWMRVERLLRDYAQYHLGQTFRAATLLDNLVDLEF